MLTEFQLLRPEWLFALIPLGALLWAIHHTERGDSAWRRVCDVHLLQYLLVNKGAEASRWPVWLLAAGWLIAVLALANPAWDKRPQPVYRTLDARVVVLDLSRSMNAADMKPSRLEQARFKVADILRRSREGQTGLVVFAGDAFVVAPLTRDADTLMAQLGVLTPDIVPIQGSRVDLGLNKAQGLLKQAGVEQGQILLIIDGSNGEPALNAAKRARSAGYAVSVLGVGTPAGAPLPDNQGGFIRDASGAIVVSQLQPDELRELAAAGGGRYATLRLDSAADLDSLLVDTDTLSLNTSTEQTDVQTSDWRERGPWLVLLLLPLAALAFRRGWLLLTFLCVGIVSAPTPTWAFGWDDLWARRDQQAARALAEGATDRAAQLAPDPLQRGAAHYRAGRYEQALADFEQANGAEAAYNRGNALARLGRFREALDAYDEALAKQPGMEDAVFNRKTVEELQKQQQDQQNQPQDGQQDQEQDQQDQQAGQQGQQEENSQQTEQTSQEPQDQQESAGEGAETSDEQPMQEDVEADAEGQQPSEQQKAQQTSAQDDPGNEPDEQEQQSQAAQAQNETEADIDEGNSAALMAQSLSNEEQRALEQWLRRIPDDPGGLLRRKFLYQYQQRDGRSNSGNAPSW
ncbi:MAG: VWA domain-containing protein [Candidatus Competibacteraceae bacterium]|jgi:Ca-activated chloride channel family protein|nr:VWA domain-containing protein [Candidatus Competibacteraceae bacterium]